MPEPLGGDVDPQLRAFFDAIAEQPTPRRIYELTPDTRRLNRQRVFAGLIAGAGVATAAAAAVAIVALGGHRPHPYVAPGPAATQVAVSPTAAPVVVLTPTEVPSPTPTAIPTLVVREYGIRLTLPTAIADATYRVEPYTGPPFTTGTGQRASAQPVATIHLSTPELDRGHNCTEAPGSSIASVTVWTGDPARVSGSAYEGTHTTHVGAYWFSGEPSNTRMCTAAWATDLPLFRQAVSSVMPA